ncbi:MAG: flagellar hook-length control protein FliK [Sphingomonas sp.]|nr:flagellar hook-length control protein FliK [Sphingomonas sp.]
MPGAAAPAEGEGGDVFASLLSIVPSGETILDGPGLPDADVPVFDAQVRPVTDGETVSAGQEDEAGDAANAADEAEDDGAAPQAFTPAADVIPILQAQAGYPVTVTVAMPAQTPAPVSTDAELLAAQVQIPAAPVPLKPVVAEASAPAVPGEGKASKSVPQPTVPISASPGHDGETPESDAPVLPQPVKAALKAALARAKAGQAEAAEAPAGIVKAGRPVAAKATPSASASTPAIQTPAPSVPVQAQPVSAVAAPIATDSTVQPAPVQRAAAPLPPPADQAIERELDLAHDSEWLDRLARDIVRSGANDGPMRFRLHPQTLGHLRIELTQGDNGTNVRLIAETEAARAIIADAQPRLLLEARAQGVRIAHAEVDLAGTGHQASGDPRRQEDGRQPNFIRTARGVGLDAAPVAEPGRASSDRYA